MRRGLDGRRHIGDRRDGGLVGHCVRAHQALHEAFCGRRECRDRHHFGHCKSTIERMDGTNQTLADGGLAIAGTGQPCIHGFQMTANFGTQDVQQHRIHGHRNGVCLGRAIGRSLSNWRGNRTGLYQRQRCHDHVFAGRQAIGNRFHGGDIHIDLAGAQQCRMQLRQQLARQTCKCQHGMASRT